MWTKDTWTERVDQLLKSDDSQEAKYAWPFPMGVFGTLRERQGNNPRMHAGKFHDHRYGFLPHFYASGLSVSFQKNACAPFEVFYYEPDQWKKMIPGVDSLEGFNPRYSKEYDWGYYRTLVWIHLLPKGAKSEWFPETGRASLWEHRDMKVDPKTWDEYEKVPAWVYSNLSSNRALTSMLAEHIGIVPPHIQTKVNKVPLIWPVPNVKEVEEDDD